eukprot:TRINITY_DN19392_c0_g1_i1.p2 TRINITY_DN19392_c0_g1~~TRINITY_DN19392_c0_g1_i1.p2  ORF type:complete len:208 (-),score=11.01 TRINITY_DN19392_c0_g1_i1:65-688(-)
MREFSRTTSRVSPVRSSRIVKEGKGNTTCSSRKLSHWVFFQSSSCPPVYAYTTPTTLLSLGQGSVYTLTMPKHKKSQKSQPMTISLNTSTSFDESSGDDSTSSSLSSSLGSSPPRSILSLSFHYSDEDEEHDHTTEHDRHVHWDESVQDYARENKNDNYLHHDTEESEPDPTVNTYLSASEAAAMMKKYGKPKHGKGGKNRSKGKRR